MPCGLGSILYEVRRLVQSKGEDENYALVSVHARNLFNCFSGQRMIDLLLAKLLSLCRFLNMVYACQMPSLTLSVASTQDIPSQGGMQQGDPASILVFSLVAHPLATEIAEPTQLGLHRWYADDCTLIGTQAELNRAVEIFRSKGPRHGLNLNRAKTHLLWPRQPINQQTPVLHHYPSEKFSNDGIDLVGAPIGLPQFMDTFLNGKIDE